MEKEWKTYKFSEKRVCRFIVRIIKNEKKTIDIITLGCSKNLVDSERLIHELEDIGYNVTHDVEEPTGEIAVINTCGFIGDAKEESINMILEFAQAKEDGRLKNFL